MRRLLILLLFLPIIAFGQYRVPLVDDPSGLKYIIVSIDGVEAKVMFDTGCSGFFTNQNLLQSLVHRKALSYSDLSSESDHIVAGGESHLCRQYMVREIRIGDYVVHDVKASVGFDDQPDCDMLMGQSVLSRFVSYAIRGGYLEFVPKPEKEQQALSLADRYLTDTAYFCNRKVAEALRPYADHLDYKYLDRYAYALYRSSQYEEAVQIYYQLLSQKVDPEQNTHMYYSARLNLAYQYLMEKNYQLCLDSCRNLVEEIKDNPDTFEMLKYAYHYMYSASAFMEDDMQAVSYGLYFVALSIAPQSLSYLQNHRIAADEDVANVLMYCSSVCAQHDDHSSANKYRQMALNAGYRE